MKRLVMWYLHRQYKKYRSKIIYIKGSGNDYPRYLMYTEDEDMYKKMDRFPMR